jgi:hypothetical protein
MNHYRISGIALDWIKNYLCNRRQFVKFQDTRSELKVINCGVPQGSILGPLLFLLYVNDLPNVSETLHSILFADDSKSLCTEE